VIKMKEVFRTDEVTLDAEKVTERDDPIWGKVTTFHDVPIASEIVQPYSDGRAYKPREELEPYAKTVDGRWVMVGSHPEDGIISSRDQIHGRTVNSRYVKDLKDPKTKRPNRAGVKADLEIFNDRVSPGTLKDMKNGKKQDVSIGFFFNMDETPGVVADGPFKDSEYDYVQRGMFHDHTAAGLDNGNGRCPMPYCGLGADELKQRLTGDPFAGFKNFGECVSKMKEKENYSQEKAEKVCGMLKAEHEDSIMEESDLIKAAQKIRELLKDEEEAIKGERLAEKEKITGDWWRRINWADDDSVMLFDALSEDTRTLITEAGLCPTCQDEGESEAERAMKHFKLTEEEWAALTPEEKKELIDKLPEEGSEESPDEKPPKEEEKEEEKPEEKPEKKKKDSGEEENPVEEPAVDVIAEAQKSLTKAYKALG